MTATRANTSVDIKNASVTRSAVRSHQTPGALYRAPSDPRTLATLRSHETHDRGLGGPYKGDMAVRTGGRTVTLPDMAARQRPLVRGRSRPVARRSGRGVRRWCAAVASRRWCAAVVCTAGRGDAPSPDRSFPGLPPTDRSHPTGECAAGAGRRAGVRQHDRSRSMYGPWRSRSPTASAITLVAVDPLHPPSAMQGEKLIAVAPLNCDQASP